uniref:Solute carrier family 12 member 3 n=1 Tax=Cyprinus carpio TaxID=7962 RepID=A0A8C1IFZ0_CYPCA
TSHSRETSQRIFQLPRSESSAVNMFHKSGWRPTFRFYSKWLSLLRAVVSVIIMFLLTWWAALICINIVCVLYISDVNWGSSVQTSSYNMALSQCVGLKSWPIGQRPQCLVLGGPPSMPPSLVDFISTFTKNQILSICEQLLILDDDLHAGVQMLLQSTVMGFKKNWGKFQPMDPETLMAMYQPSTAFQTRQEKKNIDVYWLSDDGGLTLLVPYLLTRKKCWGRCKGRVFVGGEAQQVDEQKQEYKSLMLTKAAFSIKNKVKTVILCNSITTYFNSL